MRTHAQRIPGGEAAIVGLVPAAGCSSRLGRDKRQVPCGQQTVLEATVGSLRQGGAAPLVVVLEPASPCRGLAGLADALMAVNVAPERGMLSSILVGLERVPADAAGVAVLPGDHPFVPPAAIGRLLACFREQKPLLLAPLYRGRRGHPLLIARALFPEVRSCAEEVGLRELVWRHERELVLLEIELPDAELAEQDLDTPGDLERLRPKLS